MSDELPPRGEPQAPAAPAAPTVDDILRIVHATSMSNQAFADTVQRSVEGLATSVGAATATAASAARAVEGFAEASERQHANMSAAANSLAATAARNQAVIDQIGQAMNVIAANASPSSGGTPSPALGASTPSHGLWVNEPPRYPAVYPQFDGLNPDGSPRPHPLAGQTHPHANALIHDMLVDPDVYKLPTASKALSVEDVLKTEQKMSSMLSARPPLRYDKRYSFQYNIDTFMLGIRNGAKRELRKYWSAFAMYEGTNARELLKMAHTLMWEEDHFQTAPASARAGTWPVSSLDPTTLVPIVRSVSESLFAKFNSLHGITVYKHTSAYIDPRDYWDASHSDHQRALEAAQMANKRLREPLKRRMREFTVDEMTVAETQYCYRDYGVRWDDSTKRYIPNNPTFVGNSTAPSPENFATIACAIGELFFTFLGPDTSGREHLDCMPTAQDIMAVKHTLPNLYKSLENEVYRTTTSTDQEKVRTLRAFKEVLLHRYGVSVFKVRFRHAVSMLQELNTQIWKFGDKGDQFDEQLLITELMDKSIDWYRNVPEGERTGYFLGLQQLVFAWENKDTPWADSKANLQFKGVFKSLMSILQYAVDLESKFEKDIGHLPVNLPQSLSSAYKFGDTPAPGSIMAMWVGDDAEPRLVPGAAAFHTVESHPAVSDTHVAAENLLYGVDPEGEIDEDGIDDEGLYLTDRRPRGPGPHRLQQDPYFGGTPRPDAARGGGFRFDSGRGSGSRQGTGRGRAGGRGSNARQQHRSALIKKTNRELQHTQRREQQRSARRSAPGGLPSTAAGAGAHRRNEHPHSRAQTRPQQKKTDWIPEPTYRGMTKVEKLLSELASDNTATADTMRTTIRSCITDLRAARNLTAQPTVHVCMSTNDRMSSELLFSRREETETEVEVEPHERVLNFDEPIMPPEDDTDEGFTGAPRTFLRTLLTRHPDLREWSQAQQEQLVEHAVDIEPDRYLGLATIVAQGQEQQNMSPLPKADDELDFTAAQFEILSEDLNPVSQQANVEWEQHLDEKTDLPLDVKELTASDVSSLSATTWEKLDERPATPEPPRAESPVEDEPPFVPPSPPRSSPTTPVASSPPRMQTQRTLHRRLRPFEQQPVERQRDLLRPCIRPGCPCPTRAVVADMDGIVLRVGKHCCATCRGTLRDPKTGTSARPGVPCLSADHSETNRNIVVQGRHRSTPRLGQTIGLGPR